MINWTNLTKNINCEMIINLILIIIIIIQVVLLITRYISNESLTDVVDPSIIHKLKDADIVIYKTNSCGYCKKLMDEIKNYGLENYVRIVDVDTSSGKSEYSSLNETGVPVIKCEKNGEIIAGYNPIPKIIEKLNI